jgi:hypothetical protein
MVAVQLYCLWWVFIARFTDRRYFQFKLISIVPTDLIFNPELYILVAEGKQQQQRQQQQSHHEYNA